MNIDRGFFDICEAYQKMTSKNMTVSESAIDGYDDSDEEFVHDDEENPSDVNSNFRFMSDEAIHDQYSGWWFSSIEKTTWSDGTSVTVEIHFPAANDVDFDNSSVLWYLYPKTRVGKHKRYEYPIKNPTEMNGVYLPDDIRDDVRDIVDYIYDTFTDGQRMEFDDAEEFEAWKSSIPNMGESYMCENYDTSDYVRYVLVEGEDGSEKIESGWEYAEDANDRKRELDEDGISSKVVSRRFLKIKGLDPQDDKNWYTGTF